MSWIEDFNKLPLSVRSISLSIAGNIPFWFVSIFLLHNSFYSKNDLIVVFAFVLCFSLTWYFLMLLFAVISIHFFQKMEEGSEEEADSEVGAYAISAITSIVYLCIAIVLAYCFEWRFCTFLIVAYSYILFNLILLLIGLFADAKSSKSKAPK